MDGWLSIWEGLLWADGRVTAFALIAVVLVTLLEVLIPAEPGQGLRGRMRNLAYLVLYKVLGLAAIAVWYAFGPTLELTARTPSGVERVVFVLGNLVCIDFLYYWYHRAQHRFAFLWAIHELHHADAELNATSSYRTYWLEAPLQIMLVSTPPLLLFGWLGKAHATSVLVCSLFFLIFSHANLRLRLGPLGRWLIGPQVHRIHHSRLPEHQDRNFAQFFPFLDRLFGSFREPGRDEYPPTGTPGLASDASIAVAMTRPFRIWRSGLPVALAATLLTLATPARGELATIDVLLDLDEDAATGCVVGTIGGSAEGVELRIRTLVDVGTGTVTSASTATCTDPLSGAFGGESEVATAPLAPWSAVVGNGAGGSMLVETHVPLAVVGNARSARAFVVLSSVVGEDVLLAEDTGAPLLVSLRAPSVSALGPWALGLVLLACVGLARAGISRGAVAAGVLLVFIGAPWLLPARGWALSGEGELRRWLLEEQVGADPEGDAPAGVDLLEFYSAVDAPAGELWIRVDILFGAPICLPGWGQVDPGIGFVCTMQPPLDQGPFGGAVALTFDDGPVPMVTPLILATLRAQGIPATFFVVGWRLESEEGRALALEIHEDPLFRLANHSQTHARFTLLEPEEVEIEVTTASERIREAIGDPCHTPRYFRFPFGAADCASMGVVRSHGLAVASVHIDAGDWCYGSNGGVCPESVIPWIPEEFRDDLPGYSVDRFLATGGGVMLMHDAHANTAAELPAIIAGLQAAGASFVDLADPVLFPIMNGPVPAPEAPACCIAATD